MAKSPSRSATKRAGRPSVKPTTRTSARPATAFADADKAHDKATSEKTNPASPASPTMKALNPNTTRTLITTGLIIVVIVAAIFGFNALANHLSQANNTGGTNSATTTSDQGEILGGAPTPNFTLTDQNGATVSLASLKGKPTVLTFFDSVCPHGDCQILAQYINVAGQDMKTNTDAVNWVAISVNPWQDTPQSVKTFLNNQGVKLNMHYLMGTHDELQAIWDEFNISVVASTYNGSFAVVHSTGVYLLDQQTNEQIFMPEGFNPKVLAQDITAVLKNGADAFKGQKVAQKSISSTYIHSIGADQVTLIASPDTHGNYDFEVLLADGSGKAIDNATVTADLSMPTMSMNALHYTLTPTGPAAAGEYLVKSVPSMLGAWKATVTVTPQGGTPGSTTFVFSE